MKKTFLIIVAVLGLSIGTAYAFNGHLSHSINLSMPHFNLFESSNCNGHSH